MRGLVISAVGLVAAGMFAPAMAAPQYYGGGYGTTTASFRCESNDGRVNRCPLPYGGGRVVIERQISRSACVEGRTWGQERDGIWVSQGCRADFRMSSTGGTYGNDPYYGGNYGNNPYYGGTSGYGNPGYGNSYGDIVRCESNDGRTRRCNVAGSGNMRAQLVRQISRSACIEGRTWGSDRGSIWVTGGCRADFQISNYGNASGGYGYGNYGDQYGFGRLFRCESNDGRLRECAANTRAGVQLVKQLSRAACIEGRTWGYGRNGIWVTDGCRAEFRSY